MSNKKQTKPFEFPAPQALDSPNLALYPVAPSVRKPKFELKELEDRLTWNVDRVEWSDIHPDDVEKPPKEQRRTTWFLERKVLKGITIPNYQTQRVLNALFYLLHSGTEEEKERWEVTNLSLSKIWRVMGGTLDPSDTSMKPGKSQTTMIANHINCLRNMRVSIGYLSNKKKRDWKRIIDTPIIGNVSMTVREGRRSMSVSTSEGKEEYQDVKIQDIHSIAFDPSFITKYFAEFLTYNYLNYSKLESPVAQNGFRWLNSHIEKETPLPFKVDLGFFSRVE